MPDNPFSNPAFSAMGGQLVQLWQKSLESWWSALLGDSGRLGELARRLSEVGYDGGRGEGEGAASAEDLARLVEALELMDQRIGDLEAQVTEVAQGLAAVVGYLEQQSGEPTDRGGGGETSGAQASRNTEIAEGAEAAEDEKNTETAADGGEGTYKGGR